MRFKKRRWVKYKTRELNKAEKDLDKDYETNFSHKKNFHSQISK